MKATHINFASRLLAPVAAAAALASAPEAAAQFDFLNPTEEQAPPVTADLIAEVSSTAPGEAFTVAIPLVHGDHWHTYWKNSGNISLPLEVEWSLPDGWTAGPLQWPTPQVIETSGVNGYAYEHTIHLLATITPPADAAQGPQKIAAEVWWQACDPSSCVPGSSDVSLDLNVGETVANPESAKTIEAARDEIAQPLSGWTVTGAKTSSGFQLILTPEDGANTNLESAYFYPDTNYVDAQQAQKLTKDGDKFVLNIPGYASAQDAEKLNGVEFPGTFSGILFSENGLLADGAVKSMTLENIEPGAPAVTAGAGSAPAASLSFGIIGLAFLGGMILNLMPCVFPVLGLKIMGFVNQAGEDRRKIAMHGVVFTLGVLVSFWVLVAVLQIVRSVSGEVVQWGFQLQEPGFVLGLIVLMFIFSLSLAGMMEIGIGATSVGGKLTRKSGMSGTFFSGVLATVVATPCAAPFLAPALGAALSLPVFESFIAFTAIALGLSMPYLLLSAFPQLVERLPKPGPWMETFKQLMAFLMFATVAYLVWVYASLFDDNLQLRSLLFGLVVIALGVYVYGRWSAPWRSKRVRTIAIVCGILLAAIGTYMGVPVKKDWEVKFEKWSPEAVDAALAEGKPVFIDFTATWCVTCQTNKSRYVHNREVVEMMEEKGIVALKADFTRQDPQIAQAIAELGRGAVPVNVVYVPGKEEPQILDETFGADYLLGVFGELPDAE
ncbi:protein-disulfide reductase DsbD family protein [Sulfuriroseicoccus oceanibius]|uniref:Thioredoxin family protein n=1 Tax=Sulfuriroseicoccus oceanibius TaxID=2707525 RepID=A0A6B3L065_9BACT|nr:thioredoxin family protein [Sulfuriroseicoccus oceanibius]QQL43745.1 thioredoxin family protein [Sulfuriroseicoccus oceanibius]